MKRFPLIKKQISNEHIMTVVFLVSILYAVPTWIHKPAQIGSFVIIVTIALVLDVLINFFRFKRPVCAVSAAVTAVIFHVLTPGIPLWGHLIGIGTAIVIGKHLQGGTGKNIFNPAIVGVLLVSVIFKLEAPVLPYSLLLLPAFILSLPFLIVRPYAGIGMMAGMITAMLVKGTFGFETFFTYGIIFWGCMVITDPVTATPRPSAALIDGFLCAFLPLLYTQSLAVLAVGLLGFNLLSYIFRTGGPIFKINKFPRLLKIPRYIPFAGQQSEIIDITDSTGNHKINDEPITPELILSRIDKNEVHGYGGGAFPTITKIKTVLESKVDNKYFIINGVECDPGLIHDKWMLQKFNREIEEGIALIQQCIPFTGVFLAAKQTDGISFSDAVTVVKVPDGYPIGTEKKLIERILKQKLAYDEIPAQSGILVLNLQTVYALYEAVIMNKKAETRYLTAANFKTKTAKIMRVKFGQNIREVIGNAYPATGSVFSGGGMMQAQTTRKNDVVEKSTNFIAITDLPYYKESPLCSRCDSCIKHCPSGLIVNKIINLVDTGEVKKLAKYHPERCMSCGSCSYVCPAGRNLSARIQQINKGNKS